MPLPDLASLPPWFDYEETILHECGHAVIALAQGIGLTRVHVGPWDGTYGCAKWVSPPTDWYAFAVVARAGEVAQRRFGKGIVRMTAWPDDRRAIKRAVREHSEYFPGFVNTLAWWRTLCQELADNVEARLADPAVQHVYVALCEGLRARLRAARAQYQQYEFTGAVSLQQQELDDLAKTLAPTRAGA